MSESSQIATESIAADLVRLYEKPFGGKARGRFRIPIKLVRRMLDQKRIWPEQVEAIRRALYEHGYVLHDMESYWVVVSQRTFASYRRVNEASILEVIGHLANPEGATGDDEPDEAGE